MVQVIERLEDAGAAGYIKFTPYRSPRDHNLILGSWQHGVSHQGVASIGMSLLGTPVKDDYKRAYNEAVQYGVPFLWVDDPAGLFPPADRPTPP